jgi:transposase
MRQKSVRPESPSERPVKNIRRATRKRHRADEKIRIVLDDLCDESSIAELRRREGIAKSLDNACSKEFLEAGKRRQPDGTMQASSSTLWSRLCMNADAFIEAGSSITAIEAIHRCAQNTPDA